MSRVLVVGRWPDAARRRTGFPEQRTEGIARTLATHGADLRIAGLVPPSEPTAAAPGDPDGLLRVPEEGPGWLEAIAAHGADAEVVVGAGPYNGPRAACLVAGDRPVWADLPGDPFAEVQAWALAEERDPTTRQAAAQAAALPTLTRADGFGVISRRQRLLLLGQLGLIGRLPTAPPLEPVDVVPVAWPQAGAPCPPTTRAPGSPLVILLSGSFNTWLDVATLQAGFERASAAGPIRLLVSGGPVAGHHQRTWADFLAWANRQGDAVTILGQLPEGRLAQAIATAHVGVCLDRPGLEAETGSRTRVLFYLQRGLDVVATPRSELTADLAARGLIHAVPMGDPGALAERFVSLLQAGRRPPADPDARARLAAELAPARVYAPIVEFIRAPRRLPARDGPTAALARQHEAILDELRRVRASPTWRLLNRVHRLCRPKKP